MGAIPLNLAELLLIIGFGSIWMRRRMGPFMGRRKIVRKFNGYNAYDKRIEEVLKEGEESKKSWAIAKKDKARLPGHPVWAPYTEP